MCEQCMHSVSIHLGVMSLVFLRTQRPNNTYALLSVSSQQICVFTCSPLPEEKHLGPKHCHIDVELLSTWRICGSKWASWWLPFRKNAEIATWRVLYSSCCISSWILLEKAYITYFCDSNILLHFHCSFFYRYNLTQYATILGKDEKLFLTIPGSRAYKREKRRKKRRKKKCAHSSIFEIGMSCYGVVVVWGHKWLNGWLRHLFGDKMFTYCIF